MKNVLIVSVHPDDETIGLGGTILKLKEQGKNLFWLNITNGNEHQETYIDLVAKAYTFDKVFNLNFPEVSLTDEDLMNLIPAISKVVKETYCDTVFIPNRSDIHTDHQVSFKAIIAAIKNFRSPFITKVLMYETLSETEFAPPLPENTYSPNVFIDITKYMKKKIDVMNIYESEIMQEPFARAESSITALARYRGSRIGVEYAEAFMLLFQKM